MKRRVLTAVTCLLLGMVTLGAGKAPPIVFGVLVPLSGDLANSGERMKEGFDLAAEEINQAGGIMGQPVKMVYADSKGNAEVGVTEAKRLIGREGAFALLGAYRSGVAMAVAEVAADARRIFMVTNAITSDYTALVAKDAARYKYLFRNASDIRGFMDNMLPLLQNVITPRPRTYYFAGGDVFYSRELRDHMKRRLEAEGIQEIGATFSAMNATDFTATLLDIRQKKPDIVLLSIDSDAGITFVKQYYDLRIPTPIAGFAGKFIYKEIVGPLGEKGDYLGFMGFTWDAPLTPKTQPFYRKYVAKYRHQPTGYEDVRAYDAIYLFKDAIERARKVEPDAVAAALERTKYAGVAGEYTFDKSHQATVPGLVGQWVKGEAVLLWPKHVATGTFKRAPWWKAGN
jgi:branched-chain amino acid transport system substrate-binding protein